MQASTSDTVLSDVSDAYEALRSNEEVVQLYTSGYLKQAQDSRDISEYAYKRGATSLLDFLDAERSNRAIQLAYRQALSSYMTALEQLKASRRNEEPSVKMPKDRRRRLAALTVLSAIVLAFVGCSGAGSESAAKNNANNANTAELFTIPANQMAHVQVLDGPANQPDANSAADWNCGL